MNLVIDVGNTFIKFAVFNRDALEYKVRFKSSDFIAEFKAVKEAYPNLKRAIISSVGNLKADCIELATENIDLITFCLLYTSPSPRDRQKSRMPSSA